MNERQLTILLILVPITMMAVFVYGVTNPEKEEYAVTRNVQRYAYRAINGVIVEVAENVNALSSQTFHTNASMVKQTMKAIQEIGMRPGSSGGQKLPGYNPLEGRRKLVFRGYGSGGAPFSYEQAYAALPDFSPGRKYPNLFSK